MKEVEEAEPAGQVEETDQEEEAEVDALSYCDESVAASVEADA